MRNDYAVEDYTTICGLRTLCRPLLYSFSDSTMFTRIYGVLWGIIDEVSLQASHGKGLVLPLILVIMRCYLGLTGNEDAEVLELCQTVDST
jgi:hypothetical protein